MRRFIPLCSTLALFLCFSSCFKSVSPALLKYGTDQAFISVENQSKAQKLSLKYPDQAFYGNETEILVEFYLEEGKKKKKAKKGTAPQAPKEKELEATLKTDLKAKVTYYHSVLAIKDFQDFSDGIYYNDMMKVSPIHLSYDAHTDDAHWSRITSVSSSYEVDGLYYSDARIKYFSADIPARGTELHYTYTVTYENINYLANLFFIDGIPTEKKNITFQIPDWLEMGVIEKNLEAYGINKNNKRPRNSRISEFREKLDMDNPDMGEEEEEEETGNKKKRKKRVKYTYQQYEAASLPAQKEEILAAGPTHNQPHILLALKKYTDQNGKEQKLLSTLPDLYAWYRSLVVSVENDTSAVSEKARSIVANVQGDEARVKELFYWVQDNVRYIAYEDGIAGFKPEACQKVFDNRYGDCKGMANLLTQMLRSLGYDARLTWIGTRRIAYDYSEPSLAVDNHMICTLILNGQHYFLDPTEDFIEFGDYAHRIQGRQVLIENGDSFMVDTIPNLSYERNRDEKTETLKLVNDELIGKVQITYRGESKTNILRYYHGVKSDRKSTALERFLNDGNINLKVSAIQHDELSERNKDIHFSYQLTVKNRVLKKGNDILINLDWETELNGLELDSTRIADVDFGYKMFSSKTCRVELPQKSSIRYMPPKLDVTTADYRILMEYKMEGNTLVYTKQLIFYDGKIPAKSSKEWADVYEKMSRFYRDYVVLSN